MDEGDGVRKGGRGGQRKVRKERRKEGWKEGREGGREGGEEGREGGREGYRSRVSITTSCSSTKTRNPFRLREAPSARLCDALREVTPFKQGKIAFQSEK